jgi:hypothetical protein
METINNIELINPEIYPDENVLRGILGKAYSVYVETLKMFDENNMTYEWRFYRDGKAWLCKVQNKKRTIVWMSAWKGFIQATIYFPEKYINDIYGLLLSEGTITKITNAKKVGKSIPCIFELKSKAVLKDFSEVMQFKLTAK